MATKKRALETQSGFGDILPLDSSQWEVSSFVKPDLPKQEKKEEPGNFTRGFKKSMYQIPQTIGGTLGLLGDTLGADGLRDYGMDVYENNTKKVEGLTRESDSLSSVMEGNGNLGDWLSSGAGYVGGQALTAIGTGGIGALVGRKIAERGIRHMLENQIEKEAAKIALSKAAKVGAASASFGNNLVQEAGSIYPEALLEAQKNGVDLSASDKARIIGSSLAAAGVDTLGEALIAKKFLSGGRRAITNSAGEQVSESIGRAALREVPLGMAKEAGTEGVQTAIERYGANQDMSSKEAIRDYVDSAALGALGGASGGSVSSITKQKLPETGALSRAANAGIDAQNAQAPVVPMSVPSASNKFTGMDSLLSAVQNGDNPSLVREVTQRQAQQQLAQPESLEGVPANFTELLQQSNQAREQERIDTRESWEGAKEQAAQQIAEQDRIEQENRLRLPAPDMPMPEGALIDDNGTLRPQTYQDAVASQVAAAQREELGQPVPYGERGGIENVSVPSSPSALEVPTYILHPSGKPFTNKIGAQTRLKQLGGNHTIVPYESGFAIQNNDVVGNANVDSASKEVAAPDRQQESQPEVNAIQPGDIMHPSGKPFTVKYPAIMTQRQSGGEIVQVDGGYIVRPPKQPSLEEIVAESQSEPTYEKGKTGAETARNKLDAENPFLSFLAKYGLRIDERSDVGGERGKARLIPGHGPLFRQNGLRLDELAQMAKEAGFLSQEQIDSETDNGGVNALSEMIGQALNNEVVPKVQSEPEVNPDVEMLNEATKLGLDTAGKTPDQVYDMIKAFHDQKYDAEQEQEWNTAVELFNDLSQEAQDLAREYNLQELNFDIKELENAEENDTGSESQVSEPVARGEDKTEEVNRSDNEAPTEQARGVDAAESGSQEGIDPPPVASGTDNEAETGQDLAKAEAAKPTAPITDFGEKIGGAKKDVWSGFKDKMDAAKELDIASEPLSKSWPEPDYQALLDNGGDPWAVGFMHAARDAVPRKPTKSYKLKSWVNGVEILRNFATGIADGTIPVDKVKSEIRILAATHSQFQFLDLLNRIELYQAVGHSKSLADVRIGYGEYAMLNGVEYKPSKIIWTVEKKAAATAFSNFPRQLAQGTTKQAAIEDFKTKFSTMEITKLASKEVTFDVFSERGKPGFFVGKKVGRNFITLAGPFDTVKEARAHRNDNQDQLATKLEKAKEIPSERRDTNNPRVGEDMREGKNVTSEMFSDAFGFRGVEFGNYVEQSKRQADLNEAYDALMDMAALLGIPPKSISLNGSLGLAFGARGSGGKQAAAAHYESNKVVINLTKKSGSGSLGHEWWHALDNYFSRMAQKPGSFMTERLDVNLSGKGSNYIYRDEGVRKEMIDAFGEVIKSIRSTAIKARSSKLDGKRTKEYWTTDVEMSARAFESYLISKLQDNNASNDYLANIIDPTTWAAAEKIGFELDDSYPYPTAGEIPAIRAGFDHLFSVIESKETDQGIALFSRERSQRSKFGFDVDELQPIVDQISSNWKNAPKINIVQTIDDLPFDAPNDARGAYFKKQVYLVAANLRNRAEAEAVLLHETLGHAGLNELFGKDLGPALRSIAMKNRKIAEAAAAWRKSNTDIKGKMSDDRYHLVSIEEALADYAGTGRTINGVEKLIAAIQKGLRAIGLNSIADWMENVTDVEVLSMLASARKHVEKGSDFSVFGEQQAQAFSRETTPTPEEILAMEAEEITLEPLSSSAEENNDPVFTENREEIERDLSIFISSFQEGTTRHLSDSASVRKIKRYSESAANDIRGDESAERSSPSKIGSFSSYETTARVEQNFYGNDQLVIDVYGHEQIEAGLDDHPALKIELQQDGDFSIYALPSSSQTYKEFVKRGWAEPATGKDKKIQYFAGEDGEFWTRLTGTKRSEIFPLLGDIHARALAWTGKPKVILSWQRTTGASGGTDGHRAAVFFSRTKTVGDNNRTRTPEQLKAFENVGRTIQVPTLKERFSKMTENLGKKLAQGIVDQFAPIKDLSEEAYGLMRLSKGASGAFEAMLKGGQLKLSDGVYDFDDAKRGGVIDRLLSPLQGESDDFMWWIAGNRAETLSTQGKENLFTASDIKAFKSLADGQTSFDYTIQHGIQKGKKTRDRTTIYNDSLKTFNEFNKNTLDMAEQSGLIDAESRKLWESEFYIPFYRVNEESDDGVRGMNIKSGVVRQQAFKKLKGGSDKLNSDLLENTLMNWAHLLDASAKNRAAKASLEAAAKVGAATSADSSTKKTVWYMDSGEKRYYTVEDPHLLTAIQGLEYAGMRSPIMNAMSTMKHAMTMGVTASPFFKVRNLIRDSVAAIGIAGLDYNPGKNIKEGWKLTDPKSDEYFKLLAGGGTIHFGSMLEGSEAKRVRKLVESGVDESTILLDDNAVKAFYRKHVSPVVDAYNELGNRGESINRASLYAQLIKQGKSHAEASLQARDLMDFSMQGAWTSIRFLTQVVPFMNARLQGLYKLGKSAKEDPKRFGTVLGAVSVASIALMLAYSDDDDWKKREDWDRDNFWWFKFGGTAFRIPKPFEIGAIGTLAERGIEYFTQDEMTGERFMSRFKHLMMDSLSMNPIPQMIKPVIDVYANKDSFTGRPIETMSMERLQSDYRFNGSTSMAARGLSTAGNSLTGNNFLSPVQIDHLIRGYFGWLGSFVVGAADKVTRPLTSEPIAAAPDYLKVLSGGMVADTKSAPSRYVTQMYEQSKVLDEAYGTWRMLIKTGKIEEAKEFAKDNADKLRRYKGLQNVKKQATSLNEQVRVVERSSLSADEKRDQVNLIQQRKDNIARRASL